MAAETNRVHRSDEISTQPVLDLIAARADTLERLMLSDFTDLPQELIESLQKCQALVRLELKNTNLTLKDVVNVLEAIKIKVLTVPGTFLIWKSSRLIDFNTLFFAAINGMTSDLLTKVLSFSSIKDLNISKAALSREDMATVLDHANVTRLFLNDIESLDFDLIKTFVTRNRDLRCLSLVRTPVKEKSLMEFFPTLGHDSLEVLVLPAGTKLLFSGAHHWNATAHTTKLPNMTRIEIRLSCDPHVRDYSHLIFPPKLTFFLSGP